MKDGIKLIYLHEDAGRVTDTGVYLAPGIDNAVEVGTHLNGDLAEALVERGICAVYEPDAHANSAEEKSIEEKSIEKHDMPWLEAHE